MNPLTSILVLLQMVASLVALVQQNPQLPKSLKQSVISQAQNAITLASNVLAQEQRKLSSLPPYSSSAPSLLPLPYASASASPPPARISSPHRVDPEPDYDLEYIADLIHRRINDERNAYGHVSLTYNADLAAIARAHSADQTHDNIWSTDSSKPCGQILIRHEGTTEQSFHLGDRLRTASIAFRVARENIAGLSISENLFYRAQAGEPEIQCPHFIPDEIPDNAAFVEAQSIIHNNIERTKDVYGSLSSITIINQQWLEPYSIANRAVTGWLNSPGHRQNLLASDVTQTGIGIAVINDYMIITQVFIR